MADDNTAGQDDPGQSGKDSDGMDWKAEAEKWKALSRKHEDQAKANHTELTQLKSAQDTSKTELQKLSDRVQAAEKTAADMEAKAVRTEVAQAKGLTAGQAKRLTGSTREELESDADDLLEAFAAAKAQPAGEGTNTGDAEPELFGRPRERLTPGASPDSTPEKTPDQLADEVIKATRGL